MQQHKMVPPRSRPAASEQPGHAASASAPLLLVVDDERGIREMLSRLLERAGYRVLTASHGAEALQRFQESDGAIDLVITDVRMPDMSGPELGDHLATLREGLKVLYMSGYSAPLLGPPDPDHTGPSFLQKPFTSAALLARVGEMLGK
jgi:two-component system, cell cycle sensor histidine kinase and response regulator CckA